MPLQWPYRRRSITADAKVLQGPVPPAQAVSDAVDPAKTMGADPRRRLYRTPDTWQREVWDFFDSLGEFRQGITWKANMMSRVRLKAGKKVPNQDEPVLLDAGPAHDLVAELAGGVNGQAQLMSGFAVYLDVPGECYLIGETLPNGLNSWYTRSIEEVRYNTGTMSYYVAEEYGRWRLLPENCMVVRVWRPHKRWHYVADSPAKAARPLMRELELLNRHIQAQYLSRLASAGVIIFPDEITFPVREEFQDAPDPFVAEWIEIAAEAIKTPGTASSVVPIPIRVPGEYVEKIKHVDFTLKLDDNIINKRDSALSRLAIDLDMPPEALLGTRNVNHWSAWLIDEQGVKVHVAPTVELICDALTVGYLLPRLQAAGEDPAGLVVWYDASELILRPDRSEAARDVYDRLEISGETLRRENGFDESDKPSDDELKQMILQKASLQPVNTFAALDELGFPNDKVTPTAAPRPPGQTPPPNAPPVEPGPPEGAPPEGPQPKSKKTTVEDRTALTGGLESEALMTQLVKQASLMHVLEVRPVWSHDDHRVLHPQECKDYLFSCPFVHAFAGLVMPGTPGYYRCWLNAEGEPVVGPRALSGESVGMLEGSAQPAAVG